MELFLSDRTSSLSTNLLPEGPVMSTGRKDLSCPVPKHRVRSNVDLDLSENGLKCVRCDDFPSELKLSKLFIILHNSAVPV